MRTALASIVAVGTLAALACSSSSTTPGDQGGSPDASLGDDGSPQATDGSSASDGASSSSSSSGGDSSSGAASCASPVASAPSVTLADFESGSIPSSDTSPEGFRASDVARGALVQPGADGTAHA